MKKFIMLCCLLCLPVNVFAEKLVFVSEPYPPYEYIENGEWVGTDVDIIREVCKRLGIESEFLELPWKRAMYEVEIGKVDAIFSLLYTEERAGFLYYPSENLSFEKNIILALKESGLQIATIEDLKGKRVGVVVENSYGTEFDAYQEMIREECKNEEIMLRKLAAARMDVGILNELVYRSLSKKLGMQDLFQVMEYIPTNDPLYVGFSKTLGEKGELLAEQFSEVLRQLNAEGVVQQILEKY